MIGYSSGLKSITVRLNIIIWISRERSELNNTGRATALWQDGRRQKKYSAIYLSNARELLRC